VSEDFPLDSRFSTSIPTNLGGASTLEVEGREEGKKN